MNWSAVGMVAGLLVLSNIFMSIAWYGHLKSLAEDKATFIL